MTSINPEKGHKLLYVAFISVVLSSEHFMWSFVSIRHFLGSQKVMQGQDVVEFAILLYYYFVTF